MPRSENVDKTISDVLSRYINNRDNFKARQTLAVGGDLAKMLRFNDMVNGFHKELFDSLPPMNLAEMEAFAELANSRLNYIRMFHRKPG